MHRLAIWGAWAVWVDKIRLGQARLLGQIPLLATIHPLAKARLVAQRSMAKPKSKMSKKLRPPMMIDN